jgi:hypothetical protein
MLAAASSSSSCHLYYTDVHLWGRCILLMQINCTLRHDIGRVTAHSVSYPSKNSRRLLILKTLPVALLLILAICQIISKPKGSAQRSPVRH